MGKEVWKDIPGYEGVYQISTYGEVKSIGIKINSKFKEDREGNGRIMNPHIYSDGYYRIRLSKNKKRKTFKVHVLVAMAFLGHVPSGYGTVVDHIDNNPLNNHVDNLRVTSSRINAINRKNRGASQYPGVSWSSEKGKWKSTIYINGKQIHLKYCMTEVEAFDIYKKKYKEVMGDDLNIVLFR
jgi:hypothetical protein